MLCLRRDWHEEWGHESEEAARIKAITLFLLCWINCRCLDRAERPCPTALLK